MCIILDANCFGNLMNHDEDMEPVRKWIQRRSNNNKIAFSNTDKFKREWSGERIEHLLRTLSRRGKIKMIPSQEVESEANKLKGIIKSNDEHIIALAKVAGVNVLVSHDINLHKDFKELIKGGKVYQKAKHKHLLRNDLCP